MKNQNCLVRILSLVWLTVLSFGGFCSSSLGQEATSTVGMYFIMDLPQISSKHLLRLEAVRQAVQVDGSIHTKLDKKNENDPRGQSLILDRGDVSVIGISNAIRRLRLSVEVSNPLDYLYTSAAVRNKDGDYLLVGNKQFNLIPRVNGGDYVLPEDYGDVELELNDVPLYIPGASQGYIIPLRDDGSTDDNNVEKIWTEPGKVHFRGSLTEQNAIFAVYFDGKGGGHFEYWNIRSGTNLKGVRYSIQIKSTVRGIQPFVDRDVDVVIPTVNGRGRPIMAELHQTTSALRTISFRTSEKGGGWWFSGLWVVDKVGMRTPYPVTVDHGGSVAYVELPLGPGVYHLIPVFGSNELIDEDQPGISIKPIPVTPE